MGELGGPGQSLIAELNLERDERPGSRQMKDRLALCKEKGHAEDCSWWED